MSRKMLVIGMACLMALLSLGVTVPAQAQDVNFYLDAWDVDALPNYEGVSGLSFRIHCYNAQEEWVGSWLFYPGGGGLYWRVLTPQQLAGCVTWAVEFVDDNEDWDLFDPMDPYQFQGDIDFNGNNPADPPNWWFEEQ